jgi:hypothetical protein
MIAVVEARRARVGIAPLCGAVGLARATFSRRRDGPLGGCPGPFSTGGGLPPPRGPRSHARGGRPDRP